MIQISRHRRVSNDKSLFFLWEQLPIAPATLRIHVDQGISFLLFVMLSYAQLFYIILTAFQFAFSLVTINQSLIFSFNFPLQYNCFTMLCSFQLCNNMNQLFSSVQLLSRVQLFTTPRIAARQASLSITNSRSLLKLMSIESAVYIHRSPLSEPPSYSPVLPLYAIKEHLAELLVLYNSFPLAVFHMAVCTHQSQSPWD